MASPHDQQVSLRIPPHKPYAAITKVAAVSLAKRFGMNRAELNDLTVVVDQAMVMLLDGLERRPTKGQQKKTLYIDVVFRVVKHRFEFEAARSTNIGAVPEEAIRRFTDTSRELLTELRVDRKTGAIRASKASAAIR